MQWVPGTGWTHALQSSQNRREEDLQSHFWPPFSYAAHSIAGCEIVSGGSFPHAEYDAPKSPLVYLERQWAFGFLEAIALAQRAK
jgi:hypothetical protein